MNDPWGIPVVIRETVTLEEGDKIPDGNGDVWNVISVREGDVLATHNKHGAEAHFPRELDLNDEAPGYILRPPRPTAYVGKPTVERLRTLTRLENAREGKHE